MAIEFEVETRVILVSVQTGLLTSNWVRKGYPYSMDLVRVGGLNSVQPCGKSRTTFVKYQLNENGQLFQQSNPFRHTWRLLVNKRPSNRFISFKNPVDNLCETFSLNVILLKTKWK